MRAFAWLLVGVVLVVLAPPVSSAQERAAATPRDAPLSFPGPNLMVYDAKNKLVGHVVSFVDQKLVQISDENDVFGTAFLGGAPLIRLRAGATDFYLVVPIGDFNTIEGGVPIPNSPLIGTLPLFYESADCTGPPFIAGVGMPATGVTGMNGWIVYVPDSTGMGVTITASSTGTGFECTALGTPASVHYLQARRLIDLAPQKWKTPFRLK